MKRCFQSFGNGIRNKQLACAGLLCILAFGVPPAAIPSLSLAQEDPFGASDPFGDNSPSDPDATTGDQPAFGLNENSTAPTAPRTMEESSSSTDPLDRHLDPLILILRENPPQTIREFGRALYWMTQLGHWSEVAGLLDQVAAKKWNLPQQAELARSAGAATWIRLKKEDSQLNATQRELVGKLWNAPASVAKDPSNVDRWIDQLGESDASKRRAAQLRLQDGGSAAIERLLERLLQGDTKVGDLMLAGTVVEFGRPGIEALQAACTLGDPAVTSRILLAIAELPSNHFPVELAAGLHGRQTNQELKTALATKLTQRKIRLPNESATATHLLSAMNNALADYQNRRVTPSQLQDLAWRASNGSLRVEPVEMERDLKALERLYQIAQHRAWLTGSQSDDWIALAAIGFQRAYQQDAQQQDPKLDEALLAKLPPETIKNPDFWTSAFRQAEQWEMHGGCVRILRMFTEKMKSGLVQPNMQFLSELLADPRPIIRYQALEAVAGLDPRSDYAGSERALAIAVEMLQLGTGTTALVIGANLELCMSAEANIRQVTGGDVSLVTSGREALQALTEPNPADLIIVVDRVHDMSLFELLQRLRKTQGGGSLPIAVMTDQLYPYEQQYIEQTPGVLGEVLSKNPEAMRQVVQTMMESLDTQPISNEQRLHFLQSADAFLGKISEDRGTYSFYPFDSWHDSLIRLPASVSNAARTQVLASLGTNQSQMRLVQLVVASGATQAERTATARAFEKSIKRFGTLLTAQDVQSAYDLYNRLGPNDPAIAKAMAFVLDVVEAQAGTREWPTDPGP